MEPLCAMMMTWAVCLCHRRARARGPGSRRAGVEWPHGHCMVLCEHGHHCMAALCARGHCTGALACAVIITVALWPCGHGGVCMGMG